MITMKLGGVSLGENFPVFGRAFDFVRKDEQGASFKRVRISLSGFLTAENSFEVMSLYETLKEIVDINNTTFTYIDHGEGLVGGSGLVLYEDFPVYVGSYQEPQDGEFAKWAEGDYGIELYYFESTDNPLNLTASYGGYNFDPVPSWSRQIKVNRESHRGPREASSEKKIGSTAFISLSGFLFADSPAELMTKIDALETALNDDATLNYGSFSKPVRIIEHDIQPATLMNFAYYDIKVAYDIGEIISMRRTIRIPRIHQNPVVTEEPFCSRRLVEFMNRSSQQITYSISIEAESIAKCRELLAEEFSFLIEPGGIEIPGGEEVWHPDRNAVDATIIKLYLDPVIANLPGTGE